MLAVPGGTITWYESSQTLEAKCYAHYSERCTLSKRGWREGAAASSHGRPVLRPLALLGVWLSVAHDCEDTSIHKDAGNLERLHGEECFKYRAEFRRELESMAGAESLLQHESPLAAGEAKEPNVIS